MFFSERGNWVPSMLLKLLFTDVFKAFLLLLVSLFLLYVELVLPHFTDDETSPLNDVIKVTQLVRTEMYRLYCFLVFPRRGSIQRQEDFYLFRC